MSDKHETKLDDLLRFTDKQKASDLHLSSELPPMIRVDGDIKRLNLPPLDRQQLRDMIYSIMTDSQVKNFEEHWEADFSTEVKGIARFRVNVFNQNRGLAVVFRTIPSRVLSLEDLKAPEKFVDIIDVPRGLVLVTGPTGSGKSTTLAAMLNHINENKHEHILTIEDPIEFVHESKKCLVNQREVHRDTQSFSNALRAALREDPDIILVGELRDLETIRLALTVAETGHLCLATLHATNSVQALERIYNFFPREQRHQIQPELAENLHCLITQRLLPRSDRPGRIVAMEMMMNTPYISHLISEGDLGAIPEAMERGNPAEGVFTFDHSIFELYESGVISFQDAINYVESENNFRIRIRAQSNRRLPPEMQSRGEIFSVKSDDALSRELMRKDREERERLRKEGKL